MTKLERIKIEDPEDLTPAQESLLHLVLGSPTCEDNNNHNFVAWIILAIVVIAIFFVLIYCVCGKNMSSYSSGMGIVFALILFSLVFFAIAFAASRASNQHSGCN